MKKYIFFLSILILWGFTFSNISMAMTLSTSSTDNQIVDMDNDWSAKDLWVNFNVQKFSSCENYGDVMKKFIKTYYDAHPWNSNYWREIMLYDDIAMPATISKATESSADAVWSNIWWDTQTSASSYSQTNIQVEGVDESEIVKTDWKYIYYYNSSDKSIYIVKSYPAEKMEIIKKIALPQTFESPEIYISWTKLVILATKYLNWNYWYYWFNRQTKTVTVVYDISNINSLKLEKYYLVDWNYSKSRKIWDYVYVLSNSNFSFPYSTYYWPMMKWSALSLNSDKLNSDFDAKKLLPKKSELRSTSNKSEQNVKIKWKNVAYNANTDYVSKCADIEYIIPDEETIKKFDFSPSYLTLSIINIKNPEESVKTKLLFWDVSETYMSLDNLYITSNLYTTYDFKCPQIQCIKAPCPVFDCYMPYYNRWENTLIHKISINWSTAKYQNTAIIPWTPLNQYSMDEKDWNFRIVTSLNYPKKATNVTVLDKNLKTIWKIEWIAENENFQSARFMKDKLYLVTFKQIDPLFVINIKDPTNPSLEWELKIPWYSTYLHPYDDNTLIWLWYDTMDNKWWGTINAWLKIDLYDVSDIKNPTQKYSLTLWWQWSYSEVLNNPRVFSWDSTNKMLHIPATIFTSANDENNPYRHSDAFQWLITVQIDKDTWIKELSRITHIKTTDLEKERTEECEKYSKVETPKCQKLIWWWEYCPPVSNYVPEYCYESSTAWEYFANKIWNYSNNYILRSIYMDNYLYTISNAKIQANDMKNDFKEISWVELK